MKRRPVLIVITVLALSLLCVFAGAEEETLFPARGENGLWGYINEQNEWVIDARFTYSAYFQGNYASASGANDKEGIIDKEGNWVLNPNYTILYGQYWPDRRRDETDTKMMVVLCKDNPDSGMRAGFFDTETGYFSGFKWRNVYPYYTDSSLVAVTDPETNLLGYADRHTGEMIIPCQYFNEDEPHLFENGVTVVTTGFNEKRETLCSLIDEQGNILALPEGLQVTYDAFPSCNRIKVMDTVSGLVGFIDTERNLVIPAIYVDDTEGLTNMFVYNFSEDRAVVSFSETESGLIDPDGNIVISSDQFQFTNVIRHGYAPIEFTDGRKGWVSKDGRVFEQKSRDVKWFQENRFWASDDIYDNNRDFWEPRHWHLTDEEGNILSRDYLLALVQGYEAIFYEGLVRVQDESGLWGYLDENGLEVIPCRWDEAHDFSHGRAYVESNGKTACIDHEGKIIWQEP